MLAIINGTSGHDRDALRHQNEQLRAEVTELRRREAERARRLAELSTDLRTLLTPVSGYLQVIARRRPLARQRPVEQLIAEDVLPRVADITRVIDSLAQPPAHRSQRRR
jgi:hypothetical protein